VVELFIIMSRAVGDIDDPVPDSSSSEDDIGSVSSSDSDFGLREFGSVPSRQMPAPWSTRRDNICIVSAFDFRVPKVMELLHALSPNCTFLFARPAPVTSLILPRAFEQFVPVPLFELSSQRPSAYAGNYWAHILNQQLADQMSYAPNETYNVMQGCWDLTAKVDINCARYLCRASDADYAVALRMFDRFRVDAPRTDHYFWIKFDDPDEVSFCLTFLQFTTLIFQFLFPFSRLWLKWNKRPGRVVPSFHLSFFITRLLIHAGFAHWKSISTTSSLAVSRLSTLIEPKPK
jgi:hypothetical protein